MIEKLHDKILEIKKEQDLKQKKLDSYVSSINDDIIRNSSFEPLEFGGYRHFKHSLKKMNNGNLVFESSIIHKIAFYFTLILLFFYNVDALFKFFSNEFNFIDYILFLGIIFVMYSIYYFVSKESIYSYIFNFNNGYFYNFLFKKDLNNIDKSTKNVLISNIHALQILRERVKKSSHIKEQELKGTRHEIDFDSYELNMILKDSSRVNIVDHSNLDEIRKNAQILSERLGVKVYDIIDFKP